MALRIDSAGAMTAPRCPACLPDDWRIEDCRPELLERGCSVRSLGVLRRSTLQWDDPHAIECHTIGDVRLATDAELLALRNCGPKTLAEIRAATRRGEHG